MKNRQHCETPAEYNLRIIKRRLRIIEGRGNVRFYHRDNKGRFISQRQWGVEKLKSILEFLPGCVSYFPYTKALSKEIARDTRQLRIRYRIYETF